MKPALQRQGMELRPDGRLVMPDGEGGILFSVLTNAEPDDTSRLITLLLPTAGEARVLGRDVVLQRGVPSIFLDGRYILTVVFAGLVAYAFGHKAPRIASVLSE